MPVVSRRKNLPSIIAPDDTWRLCRDDPPPFGTLCEGLWPAWTGDDGVRRAQKIALCIKGARDEWHADQLPITRLNMLIFSPTFWRPVPETT